MPKQVLETSSSTANSILQSLLEERRHVQFRAGDRGFKSHGPAKNLVRVPFALVQTRDPTAVSVGRDRFKLAFKTLNDPRKLCRSW